MRAPEFWTADKGSSLLSTLLTPAGIAYDLGGRIQRALVRPVRVSPPVLCVGNLVAGGAGKTPVALALGQALLDRGRGPHFLSRGYGGREPGPLKVDPGRHDVAAVGDEALLLARVAPTWVSRDRPSGARAAAAEGAGLIIMDDGFQNPSLAKDLSVLVVDGAVGFGNGRVMPAGPLREMPGRGLARADAVILIGGDRRGIAKRVPEDLPILHAHLCPSREAMSLRGRRVLAFAGIARPGKFFETLIELEATLVETRTFPDHHPYSGSEIEALLAAAGRQDAVAVTTEKDAVRLPSGIREEVVVLAVALAWDDAAKLDALLDRLPSRV